MKIKITLILCYWYLNAEDMLSRSPVQFTALEHSEHIQIFQISNTLQVSRLLQTQHASRLDVCVYVYMHTLHAVCVYECVCVWSCVAPLIVPCWSSTIQSVVKRNRLSSRTFSRPLSRGESLESLDRSRSSPYSTRQTFTSVRKTIKLPFLCFKKL